VSQIIIWLGEQGVKVEADGFTGKTCEASFNTVVEGLGLNPGEASEKPEYYETQQDLGQNLNQ
jgi:hypothetical protein